MTLAAPTDDLLADLNDPQRRAVLHRDGALLVLAGPGSGKTRVITRRAACLVRGGVAPGNILAITFTNKAADEMRSRLRALGVEAGMWVHTFHALAVRLLREFGERVGVARNFVIYDEPDQLAAVKEAMARCGLSDDFYRPDGLLDAISHAKNRLQTPADALTNSVGPPTQVRAAARVYEVYDALLRERNALDFDDLLFRLAVLLQDHPDLTQRLGDRFRYVLIDEYQDTNRAQYLIARLLAQRHGNICATGDPDQSIYGWRGADLNNILEFERDYPACVTVRLEQNYRSTGNILRAASALIRGNARRKHKELWTQAGDGEPVQVLEFDTGEAEAQHVAREIAALRAAGRPYSDAAVFYRVNALSRALEEALRNAGIPYKVARGVAFYQRREVRDVLAYLRVLVNPADEVSLLRIINTPPRGIGKTTLDRLRTAAQPAGRPLAAVLRDAAAVEGVRPVAAQRVASFVDVLDRIAQFAAGPVAPAMKAVLEISGLEAALRQEARSRGVEETERLENVRELLSSAAQYDADSAEPSIADFLRRVALTSDQDAVDPDAGCVMLMTLHAAKGLEFPAVFLIGLEEGLLPHERALRGAGDLEEERRLCFVGLTRARRTLVISRARQRMIAGVNTPRAGSRFLRELPAEGVVWREFTSPAGSAVRPAGGDNEYDQRAYADDHPPSRRRAPGSQARARRGQDLRDPNDADLVLQPGAGSRFADWKGGTFVEHATYGIGQVVWIRPEGSQTRASIRFPHHGERVFVLDVSPVRKLK